MHTKYTPENITSLNNNEIFVFGSNIIGNHAGGAARVARKKFGAIRGQGVGLQGQSYAIPTMQGGVETIKPYVDEFIEFAKNHKNLTFFVTKIGCGIAGFKDEQIAPLFDEAFDLDNVYLPESFAHIINHSRQLASETANMVFHNVPIEFFPEDMAKAENMGHKEKMDFIISLKKEKRYRVLHDSPKSEPYPPILNSTEDGHHIIAITNDTFAIAANTKLYSNRYEWGLDFDQPIMSVIPIHRSKNDQQYGQFAVLLKDGTIKLVWSDTCIKDLSNEKNFVAIASGCGESIFGLRKDGTVAVISGDKGPSCFDDVKLWSEICQIEAGPRHIVGLRKDGRVVASGKTSACEPLSGWCSIKKIYVSKASPLFAKENDLTFGIDNMGWLHVGGDLWDKGKEFWKRIRAQYDVTDVIENGYAVWVRTQEGEIRCVTYYSKVNYLDEIKFLKKYQDKLRYMDTYGSLMVLVDKDGEFRVYNSSTLQEMKWWC